MDALAKAGHIDEAKSVFSEMKKKCVTTGMSLAQKKTKREFMGASYYDCSTNNAQPQEALCIDYGIKWRHEFYWISCTKQMCFSRCT